MGDSYGSESSIESFSPKKSIRYVTVVVVSIIQILSSLSDNVLVAALILEIKRRAQVSNTKSITLYVEHCKKNVTLPSHDIRSIGADACTDWTSENIGYYTDINFGTFIVTVVIIGVVSDKYGGKYPLLAGLVFRTILNFVTPILMESTKCNFYVTVAATALYGSGQGFFIISITAIVAHWVPPKERSLVAGLTLLSEYVGYSMHFLLAEKMILAQTDYRNLFYIMGSVSAVLTAVWWFVGYSSGLECKMMSSAEDLFLKRELGAVVTSGVKKIPIKSMVLSINVWALVIGACSPLWISRMGGNLITMYLRDIRGKDLGNEPIWWSSKIATAIIVVTVFGFLSDYLINHGLILTVTVRKFFTNICASLIFGGLSVKAVLGTTGTVIFLIGGASNACLPGVAKLQFMLALSVLSCFGIGINLVPLDLAPNFAATLTGICYAFSFTSYFLLNRFYFKTLATFVEFRKAIWFTFIAALIGNSVFVLLGDIKIQKWNFVHKVSKAHHLKKFG